MQRLEIDALNQWFKKGRLISLNGNEIFTVEQGNRSKPCIILIHGFPTASYDFEGIWNSLAKDFRLISLDMLGFGFSDKPNRRDYTLHKQADLFETLIRHHGVDQFHVLAHDYGVSVAQELLARQIDGNGSGQWLSCCFLNGGLFPETHKALMIQKIMLSPMGKWVNKLSGFGSFKRSFSSVFGEDTKPSDTELRAFWALINYNNGKHAFHNLMTYILDRREHRERWLTALQNSPFPLALINGSVDPVSGSHLVDRYRELNCRLDYLKQLHTIGHYPQVEDPEAVSGAYLEFLNQLAAN